MRPGRRQIPARANSSSAWRFAYSHNPKRIVDNTGWGDSFEIGSDPLKQATDFAFNLLYLRADLPPCRERIALRLTDDDIRGGADVPRLSPYWRRSALFNVGYGLVRGEAIPGVREFEFANWHDTDEAPYVSTADSGFAFDASNGTFTVTTPRTCGGFSEVGIPKRAGVLEFVPQGHRATVTAMSLDNRPLAQSNRILLTHLTNVLSQRTTFTDKTRRVVSFLGVSDVDRLVANGSAKIVLDVEKPESCVVWALSTDGRRLARVPSTVANGCLTFTAEVGGEGGTRIYYELAKSK